MIRLPEAGRSTLGAASLHSWSPKNVSEVVRVYQCPDGGRNVANSSCPCCHDEHPSASERHQSLPSLSSHSAARRRY